MKLVFEKIKYQNLMSVGQKPVEIQLDEFHKTLITGKNGGGKSTLLEAVFFALFGTPFRKIKKGQLVNTQNKKKCLIELWFSYGKDSYYIKRGIKPNVFEVTKNDQLWDESSSVSDFQTRLEEQLKISPIAFKQVVVLGTAGYVPFMELSTPNRRKLVEELLEVAILGNMADLNKSSVKALTQEMSILETKIDSIRREILSYQDFIEKQKLSESQHVEDFESDFSLHIEEIKKYRSELSLIDEQILDISSKIDNNLSDKIIKYTSGIQKLDESLTNQISMLSSFKSGVCPTCSQHFSDHSKVESTEHMIQAIEDKKVELNKRLDKLREDKIQSDKLLSELTILQTKANETRSKMSVHVQTAQSLKSKIDSLKEKDEFDYSKLDSLKLEMNQAKEEKSKLFDEKYTKTIIADLLKDSGIKASIVKRYIPIFNKKINHYLKIMGADYTFTIDEEFNEKIKSRGREDFSYESFSQGERARIDLSLLFTWRDVSSLVTGLEINLLILDEVSDSATDAEGVKSIMRIIDSMKSNVFIISHREEHDKESYGRWIQMIKKGRFSTMEIKHVHKSS